MQPTIEGSKNAKKKPNILPVSPDEKRYEEDIPEYDEDVVEITAVHPEWFFILCKRSEIMMKGVQKINNNNSYILEDNNKKKEDEKLVRKVTRWLQVIEDRGQLATLVFAYLDFLRLPEPNPKVKYINNKIQK